MRLTWLSWKKVVLDSLDFLQKQLEPHAGGYYAQEAWQSALGEANQELPVCRLRGGWVLGSSRVCSTRLCHSLKSRMCLSLKARNKM